MASKELLQALVDQMNFELASGYIYLGMAAHCAAEDMDGFSGWLTKQAIEEYEHAEKFLHFIQDMDGDVEYQKIPGVSTKYGSFLEVFQTALDHERLVTKKIYELKAMADKEGCYDTLQFLDWFIAEQREEENSFKPIVRQLERADGNWKGIYALDRQLSGR